MQSIYKQSCAKAGIELELKAVTPSVFFSSDVGNPDTYGTFLADLQMYAGAGRLPDPDIFMQWLVSWQASSKANKWQGRTAAAGPTTTTTPPSGPSESSSIRSSAPRC